MQLIIYILLGLSSFLFVVVPISGFFLLNPLLSLVTDPHAAVSIASFFFLLNGTIKIFVFRRDIRFSYVKRILPISLAAAPFGALLIGYIPPNILLIIIFLLALFFLSKKINELFFKGKTIKKAGGLEISLVSLVSGFMQGTGLGAGGSLRKVFLLSEKLNLSEMNGTTSAIGVWILFVSVIVRLVTNQVTVPMLIPILYLIPIIVLATWLGRKFLKKLNERISNVIIVVVMIVVSISLGLKIF